MLGGVVFVAHGVVGAIGFVFFFASSKLIGNPQAFLIILLICSKAAALELPAPTLPTVLANATHSPSLNAPRLTHSCLSCLILSNVRLLFTKFKANCASGSNSPELLTVEFAILLAAVYRLLNKSAPKSPNGTHDQEPPPQPQEPPQPNHAPQTGMSYLSVTGFH